MSLEHAPEKSISDTIGGRLLIPALEGFRMIGVGPTKGWEMVKDGTLETVSIGRRRHIKARSLLRIAEQGAR